MQRSFISLASSLALLSSTMVATQAWADAPAPISLTPVSPTPVSPTTTTDSEDDDEGDKKGVLPADPNAKLYKKFEAPRGFFVSGDFGLTLVFGGAAQTANGERRSMSNIQPYVGITMGYDITRWFSWTLHAGRAFAGNSPRVSLADPELVNDIPDWGTTNLLTGPMFSILVWERLAIEIKALGGVTFLDPVPFAPEDGVGPTQFIAGGSLGLKYHTLLTDFSVGGEAAFYYIVGAQIPMLVINPVVVRYTF